ncbi:MAG: hypothetical protein AAFY33_00340 [Cyanobacteria bacterium J06643_4]
MTQPPNLPQEIMSCYQCLQLSVEATLEDVDAAYFRLRGAKIQSGDRAAIPQLKSARETLRERLLAQATVSHSKHSTATQTTVDEDNELAALVAAFAQEGLTIKANRKASVLHLGLIENTDKSHAQSLSRVRLCLCEIPVETYDFSNIKTVCLYGLDQHQKPQWKKSFEPPKQHTFAEDSDLFSFKNRYSNTFIFPVLLLIAALLNSVGVVKLLLFGIDIWIHEFGHATVAWLGGYRATPVPFGWTNVGEEKSLFVYFGVLILLGVLFWSGLKEKRRWPMGLAVALALVQFCMTWLISEDTFDMMLSFGGIGGEFYLSTLLIVSFYFPLPERWKWEFFRYPAVLCAGFTFLGSAWHWRQIQRGLADIPWGSLFGGAGHIGGDMNQLSLVYGWSDQRIIDTYNNIGSICIVVILSVYVYFFLKSRSHLLLHHLWQQQRTKKLTP